MFETIVNYLRLTNDHLFLIFQTERIIYSVGLSPIGGRNHVKESETIHTSSFNKQQQQH